MAVGWSPLGSYSDTSLKATPPSDFSGRGGRCGMNCGRLPDTSGWRGDHRLLGQHGAGALGALVRLGQDGVERRRHALDAARGRAHLAQRRQGGRARGQERRLRRLGEALGHGLGGRALGLRRAAGALYGRRWRLAGLAARGARAGGAIAGRAGHGGDIWRGEAEGASWVGVPLLTALQCQRPIIWFARKHRHVEALLQDRRCAPCGADHQSSAITPNSLCRTARQDCSWELLFLLHRWPSFCQPMPRMEPVDRFRRATSMHRPCEPASPQAASARRHPLGPRCRHSLPNRKRW